MAADRRRMPIGRTPPETGSRGGVPAGSGGPGGSLACLERGREAGISPIQQNPGMLATGDGWLRAPGPVRTDARDRAQVAVGYMPDQILDDPSRAGGHQRGHILGHLAQTANVSGQVLAQAIDVHVPTLLPVTIARNTAPPPRRVPLSGSRLRWPRRALTVGIAVLPALVLQPHQRGQRLGRAKRGG